MTSPDLPIPEETTEDLKRFVVERVLGLQIMTSRDYHLQHCPEHYDKEWDDTMLASEGGSSYYDELVCTDPADPTGYSWPFQDWNPECGPSFNLTGNLSHCYQFVVPKMGSLGYLFGLDVGNEWISITFQHAANADKSVYFNIRGENQHLRLWTPALICWAAAKTQGFGGECPGEKSGLFTCSPE